MSFLSHLINGISLGSIYAIIALGYTMVYGIAKMLNFAHGDVIMIGAYVCFFALNSFGLPPAVGILLAMLICTVFGIVIERLAYKPLRAAPSLSVLITAIGVSYFLQNAAQLICGSTTKFFPYVEFFQNKCSFPTFFCRVRLQPVQREIPCDSTDKPLETVRPAGRDRVPCMQISIGDTFLCILKRGENIVRDLRAIRIILCLGFSDSIFGTVKVQVYDS